MKTKQWTVDKNVDNIRDYQHIKEAAELIKRGELISFPTETVYGLGANAMSYEAVNKIFKAKGRPNDNPLIVHIASREQLNQVVKEIPPNAKRLIIDFWPGPLTIILPKKDILPINVTAGLETVAIRMPDHPIALALIKEANVPIAAPSANNSGSPSPTCAEHVHQDLKGKISGIINGGVTGIGLESTVIDLTSEIPTILRPGGITSAQIQQSIGQINKSNALKKQINIPKSPGMKYTHYAPDAPLIIVDGKKQFLQKIINEEREVGKKVGVLTTIENEDFYNADVIIPCGLRQDISSVAKQLYNVLRKFNDYNLDIIYSESFSDQGLGQAVMNRLTKASGNQLLSEK